MRFSADWMFAIVLPLCRFSGWRSLSRLDAERLQARPRQAGLLGRGIFVDDVLELDDGLGFLAELGQGVALLEQRRGGLVALRPILEQLVEVPDGLGVLLLGVVALA